MDGKLWILLLQIMIYHPIPHFLIFDPKSPAQSFLLPGSNGKLCLIVIMASSILSNLSAFVALRLTVLLNVLNSILWGTKSRKRKIFQTDFGSCLLWRFKDGRPPLRRRLGFFDAHGFSFISVDDENIESLLEIVLEAFFEYIFDEFFGILTF